MTCFACCYLPCKSNNEFVVPVDYPTIQDAVNMAPPYSVIYVNSGVYQERLIIDKPLFIRGITGATVVIVSEDDIDIITIASSNVTISNFIIRRSTNSSSKSAGVRLSNVSYCIIENNTIVGNFIGVLIEGGSFNTVQDNVITVNRYGVFVRRYQHDMASYSNIISNNLIANNSWNGIEIDWGGGNIVCANTISYNFAFGLEIPDYTPSLENVIFHNNFIGNADAFGKIYQAYAPENNYWNFSGEGNYWDDFCGADADFDAVSDLPYRLNRNVVDYFPLMGIFRTFNICDSSVNIISNASVCELNCSVSDYKSQSFVINLFISSNDEWFARISLPKSSFSFSSLEVNGNFFECKNFTENASYVNLYFNLPTGVYVIRIYGLFVDEHSLFSMFIVMLVSSILLCVMKVWRGIKTAKA